MKRKALLFILIIYSMVGKAQQVAAQKSKNTLPTDTNRKYQLDSANKGKDWENFAFLYFIKNSTQYIKADLYFHPVQKKNANRLLKELAKGVLIFYKVEFDGY